jgi:hypothetical protein
MEVWLYLLGDPYQQGSLDYHQTLKSFSARHSYTFSICWSRSECSDSLLCLSAHTFAVTRDPSKSAARSLTTTTNLAHPILRSKSDTYNMCPGLNCHTYWHYKCISEYQCYNISIIINTIKAEPPVIFVSLGIIVYPAILGVNLPDQFEISVEIHLQVRYKPSVTWVMN